MAPRIQVSALRDWTGGLNLRSDAFLLASNESPDMLNVDIDARGGFRQRWGVAPFSSTALTSACQSMWEYSNIGGDKQIMAHAGTSVVAGTGGTWTSVATRGGTCHAATFKDLAYIVNGSQAAVRWNGTSAVTLGTSWNHGPDGLEGTEDDFDAPTSIGGTGNMPEARFIASHMGYMWVANTQESGTRYPNRLRYSHPNFPEDYRASDFIDIDIGTDGDEITALVPFSDRLLIFKRHAVYALYGYSPDNFQVLPVSREVGAVSQEAVRPTDLGVYFWSWPEGIFLYDGTKITWQFEKIEPAVRNGKIPHAYQDQIQLGWGNRRLWASVPWEGSSTRSRTFVLDPTIGKGGAWVFYDLKVGPFLEFNPPGTDALLVGADVTTHRILKLDQKVAYDNFGAGSVKINSRLRTSWVDLNASAQEKTWRRPEVILKAGTTGKVFVKVFHNWDPTVVRRQFTLDQLADDPAAALVSISPTTGLPVGDGWGHFKWGRFKWARSTGGGTGGSLPTAPTTGGAAGVTNRNEIKRGQPLGHSRSVALEFRGDDSLSSWGIDALNIKYVPRRLKD